MRALYSRRRPQPLWLPALSGSRFQPAVTSQMHRGVIPVQAAAAVRVFPGRGGSHVLAIWEQRCVRVPCEELRM